MSKIQKIVRGTVKFETKVLEKAFKGNVLTISVTPTTLGSAMATDVEGFVARAYLLARRYIPRNAVFRVWGTCSFLYNTPLGVENEMNKKLQHINQIIWKEFLMSS